MWIIVRLFISGRMHQKRVVTALICWLAALVPIIGLSLVGFRFLPLVWAILLTLIMLAVFTLGFVHRISEAVLSAALIDEQFYDFGCTEHALRVAFDGESHYAKLEKLVPIRDRRRARR